jgi:hypothetical protein
MQPRHRTEFVHESRIIWQADAQRNVQIVNKNEISGAVNETGLPEQTR